MNRRRYILGAAVVVAGLSAAAGAQEPIPEPKTMSAEDAEVRKRVIEVNKRVAPAIAKTESVECTFHKTEYKRKPLEPSSAIMKRNRRGDVYLKFLKGPNEGREILYRPGKNDGNLLVSNPMFNLNLEPTGWMAMRTNRHSIKMAGMTVTAQRILSDQKLLEKLPPTAIRNEWIGTKKIYGEKATCYRSHFDKVSHPELFSFRTEICLSDRFGLPIETKVWDRDRPSDKEIRLVGTYAYENCRFNHLTDKDFDPDNPAYGF